MHDIVDYMILSNSLTRLENRNLLLSLRITKTLASFVTRLIDRFHISKLVHCSTLIYNTTLIDRLIDYDSLSEGVLVEIQKRQHRHQRLLNAGTEGVGRKAFHCSNPLRPPPPQIYSPPSLCLTVGRTRFSAAPDAASPGLRRDRSLAVG